MNTDSIIRHIFALEGWPKYTDAPADRGGPTKGGITLATLRSWRNSSAVTTVDLRALSDSEAADIYHSRFIVAPGFAGITDELLRWQVVDAGVLSGPTRATSWLQEAAGAAPDGKLGPVTLKAVNGTPAHIVAVRFAAIRIRFLGRLIEHDRTQAKWAAGWMNRATSFLDKEADRGNVTAPRPSTEVRA